MPDEEIDYSDLPGIDAAFFESARVVVPPEKKTDCDPPGQRCSGVAEEPGGTRPGSTRFSGPTARRSPSSRRRRGGAPVGRRLRLGSGAPRRNPDWSAGRRRPRRSIPMSGTSYRSRSIAWMTFFADRSDTSCSGDSPPTKDADPQAALTQSVRLETAGPAHGRRRSACPNGTPDPALPARPATEPPGRRRARRRGSLSWWRCRYGGGPPRPAPSRLPPMGIPAGRG